VNWTTLIAQCVMCYRTAAAQQGARSQVLNKGIVILLIPPLLILGLILVRAFRSGRSGGSGGAPTFDNSGAVPCGQRVAMYGIRLIRNASNWSTPNRTAAPSAANEGTAVRQRRLTTIPVTEATPTTSVMAISMGEK